MNTPHVINREHDILARCGGMMTWDIKTGLMGKRRSSVPVPNSNATCTVTHPSVVTSLQSNTTPPSTSSPSSQTSLSRRTPTSASGGTCKTRAGGPCSPSSALGSSDTWTRTTPRSRSQPPPPEDRAPGCRFWRVRRAGDVCRRRCGGRALEVGSLYVCVLGQSTYDNIKMARSPTQDARWIYAPPLFRIIWMRFIETSGISGTSSS
ncbi:hypothetical protein BV22DRAFT_1133333 [Leucogyrophana mollusca]|uniref:Uncharacterized protein n=1 Tax=Leucogyrophana mollusca TaxID=85980 RepID=A0ACB8B3Z7_9AGAM|nr:hypothetical protein BV22DRAFT_1133333 [Leucogyrophana mollusca]